MHLAAASTDLPIEVFASFVEVQASCVGGGGPSGANAKAATNERTDPTNGGRVHAACTCASGKAPELPVGSRHWGAGSPSYTSSVASSGAAELRGLESSPAGHTRGKAMGKAAAREVDGDEAVAPPPPDAACGAVAAAAAAVVLAAPVQLHRTGPTPSDAGTSNVSDLELRDLSTRPDEPLQALPLAPAAAVRRRVLPSPSPSPSPSLSPWAAERP
jgi:hypothetical protein